MNEIFGLKIGDRFGAPLGPRHEQARLINIEADKVRICYAVPGMLSFVPTYMSFDELKGKMAGNGEFGASPSVGVSGLPPILSV